MSYMIYDANIQFSKQSRKIFKKQKKAKLFFMNIQCQQSGQLIIEKISIVYIVRKIALKCIKIALRLH